MPQTKRFEIFLKQETVMNTRINWNFPQTRRGLTGAIDKYIGPGATRDEITREMCKNALRISLISILLLFLMSCVPQQSKSAATEELNDEELAQYALMEFMENLHSRKYDEAARIYGGSYQTMINHNPDVDPNNHATLLRNACTLSGMQCLRAKIIGLEEKVLGEKYVFLVEFLEDDGTLFALGPCCGGDETSFPPQSVFLFTVTKTDQNKFTVMDLPPYVP
jgi:hypothetical protein